MPVADALLRNRRQVVGAAAGGLLLAALGFAGCAGEDLTGTIANKDGKPVTWGTVTAVGPDNRIYTAPIQPDGSYRLSGLPRGAAVRISVSSPNPTPLAAGPTVGPAPGAAGPAAKADKPDPRRSYGVDPDTPQPNVPAPRVVPDRWYPIQGKYADPDTSGLTAKPGGGKHNITVE